MNDTPKPASTVVLLNVTTKWPHKVLLIKRSTTARFLPGAHVFPGGALEPFDDAFGSFLARDQQNFDRFMPFFVARREQVSKHVAAAIRETFEETGISILKHETHGEKRPCTSQELASLLSKHPPEVVPCLENLWPISWWITPAGETRRFDTWFFLATIQFQDENLDQSCGGLGQETEDHVWLSPKEALLRYEQRTMFLAPPTRSILERMTLTQSLEEFLSYVDQPLIPIRPYFIDDNNQKILLLPGDPLHKEPTRASMPVHTRYAFP